MQQMMTRWIENADARAVCEQATASQMLASPAEPKAEQRSVSTMLRLYMLLEPMNRRLGLGLGGSTRANL
jgi:hypothetical protein